MTLAGPAASHSGQHGPEIDASRLLFKDEPAAYDVGLRSVWLK